ncbi:MAG: two-component system response regulator [Cyanobacteria bacterium Co-bin13]|nr:two-component system response regulator [Cyanobacteria bacterium Co-bin13]
MSYSNTVPARVLIVDDNYLSRIAAATLLELEGYDVVEADCGLRALKLVQETCPDLILLDVIMPGMDGFEVCRQLKRNEFTRLIPVIFLTGSEERQVRLQGIQTGADDFLTKPFDQAELVARVKILVQQKRLNEDLDHTEQVLLSIASAIECRDPNTGDHCQRLKVLGQAFGVYLQLSRDQIRSLGWAGYLHDIGKVGIPDAILLKLGPLTPDEQTIMQQHVFIGERICKPLRTLQGVVPIIRHHHERWNGTGYPDGLSGEEIPLLARVFQLLDIYDALTNERPYKPALSPTDALRLMWEEVEKGWRDPNLMGQFEAFIQVQLAVGCDGAAACVGGAYDSAAGLEAGKPASSN